MTPPRPSPRTSPRPRLVPAILRRAYVDLGWTTVEIAGAFGVTRLTVWRRLRKMGIPTRSSGEERRGLSRYRDSLEWVR